MQLALVRHAIAAERRPDLPDAARPLTREGRARFAREVRGLKALGLGFELVLHSPWLRAAQTAELLAPLAGVVTPCEHLAAPPSAALLDCCTTDPTALVGHEPWLSELLAWLLTGRREHAAAFALKKGAVALLEGEPRPGEMRLVALHPPKTLRALGGA